MVSPSLRSISYDQNGSLAPPRKSESKLAKSKADDVMLASVNTPLAFDESLLLFYR